MQFLKSLIQGSFSKFPSLIFQRHKFRVESEAVKPKPLRTRADFKLESIILVVMSVRTKSLSKQIELYRQAKQFKQLQKRNLEKIQATTDFGPYYRLSYSPTC